MRVKLSLFLLILCLPIIPISQLYASNMSDNSSTVVKHVGLVLSTGGLGDKSFNDAAFAGAQMANQSSEVQVDCKVPTSIQDINNFIEMFANQTSPYSYDLIIAIGYSSANGINLSSINHPNKNFAIIDDNSINRTNVADITFNEEQGSFLAGAIAAMTTKTNTIGFFGAENISLINKFRSGYEQGARYINPNITVLVTYNPDTSNPYGNITDANVAGTTLINYGADIIYAAAGKSGLGVFDAIATANSTGKRVYGIGVDSNQDYLYPGLILTSMVKRVDTAVYDLSISTINGTLGTTYLGNQIALGLKENGVGVTNMNYTSSIKLSLCTPNQTRFDIINELKTEIIDGNITVNPALQIASQYNTVPHECSISHPTSSTTPTTTTTTTSTTPTSNQQSSTGTIKNTPGFTIFIVLSLIFVAKKKRK